MKKICFVTMGNIELAPYINVYLKNIPQSCHIIYWDREGRGDNKQPDDGNIYFRYNNVIEDTNKIAKAIGYLEYRKFISAILLQNSYDVVICLQTCVALLMSRFLQKYYKNKYIVDVRDYTYEKFHFVYKMEEKLFTCAKRCVISSEGYKQFLPKGDYLLAHNLRKLSEDDVSKIKNRSKQRNRIHISFIGFCAYQEQYKKLLLNLKNDSRFLVSFYGTRAEELLDFCRDNLIENVQIKGTFSANDILELYKDVDYINNLYGNKTPVLDYALSNKLYFAAELRIPILTCPETYMAELALEHNMGIAVNTDDANLGDVLYDFYTNMNWDEFEKGCQEFLDKAYKEQEEFETYIRENIAGER